MATFLFEEDICSSLAVAKFTRFSEEQPLSLARVRVQVRDLFYGLTRGDLLQLGQHGALELNLLLAAEEPLVNMATHATHTPARLKGRQTARTGRSSPHRVRGSLTLA